MVYAEEPFPIEADHGEDGTKLDDKRKGMDERIALRNTQKILGNNHVSCRRDGQELCQSFNNGYDNGFNPIHYSFSPFSFGLRITA